MVKRKKKPTKLVPKNIVKNENEELNQIIELSKKDKKIITEDESKKLLELQKKYNDTHFYKEQFIVFF